MSSDSRTIGAGELFVPLKGPNFDGHRFIAAALQRGACGTLLEPGEEAVATSFPDPFFIRVPDTLRALGDLAQFWRESHRAKVAAITGSNGKTTTKEMTAQILERRFRILKNEGNLNNLIGLPLSLLKLSEEHEIAVLEMGMNVPGEIRRLKAIADPPGFADYQCRPGASRILGKFGRGGPSQGGALGGAPGGGLDRGQCR